MDRLLRVDEVCTRLGLGRTRVYELIQSKELPSVQIGAARRIPESTLGQFIEDRMTGAGTRSHADAPDTELPHTNAMTSA